MWVDEWVRVDEWMDGQMDGYKQRSKINLFCPFLELNLFVQTQ